MPKRKELSGQKFGRLTVVEIDKESIGPNRKSYRIRWACKCDCGNVKSISANKLLSNNTLSCGCLRKEGNQHIDFGLSARRSVFSIYKRAAKRRNREFNLSFEFVMEITSKNCYYCGASPSNELKSKNKNGSYIYNGIDRVNNNIGYTKDNCVPCCFNCNNAKKQLTQIEFFELIRKIAVNHNLATKI